MTDADASIEAEVASVAGLRNEARPGRAPGPVGSRTGPTSESEAYREAILAKLEQGLSAVRIHQDLVVDDGDAAPSYYSVRRYVKRLQGRSPDPWRRLESPPGVEAQVDFGKGAMIVDASGRRRRSHVLRVVLSHSRKGYSEAVHRQTTKQFIRCLENAFFHFGGVPQTLVLDTLRAAVSKADWFDPELNPKAQSFYTRSRVSNQTPGRGSAGALRQCGESWYAVELSKNSSEKTPTTVLLNETDGSPRRGRNASRGTG